MLDVDRGDHRGAGEVALAVLGLDTRAAIAVEHEARDGLVAHNAATVVLKAAHQSIGELTGAAARQRPAAPLAPEHDRVGHMPRARDVERHESLVRLPQHVGLHVRALELVADDVPDAHHVSTKPDSPARVLEQPLLQRGPEPGGRKCVRAEDVLDLVVLVDHPAIGVGVGAREARHLLVTALDVEPHREVFAVGERDVGVGVG
jgi:hypothetical protein